MSTIYFAAVPESEWDGTAYSGIEGDVIAGTMPYTGVVYGNGVSPTVTGTFSDTVSGLAAGTGYIIAAVWSDGVNDSTASVSAVFTTSAVVTGTGAVASGPATVSGSGLRVVAGVGSVQSSSAAVNGVGARAVTGAGAVVSEPASIVGVGGGVQTVTGTGNVAANESVVAGIGFRVVTGSGAIVSAAAIVNGFDAFVPSVRTVKVPFENRIIRVRP